VREKQTKEISLLRAQKLVSLSNLLREKSQPTFIHELPKTSLLFLDIVYSLKT
jgi:hypothetical protein